MGGYAQDNGAQHKKRQQIKRQHKGDKTEDRLHGDWKKRIHSILRGHHPAHTFCPVKAIYQADGQKSGGYDHPVYKRCQRKRSSRFYRNILLPSIPAGEQQRRHPGLMLLRIYGRKSHNQKNAAKKHSQLKRIQKDGPSPCIGEKEPFSLLFRSLPQLALGNRLKRSGNPVIIPVPKPSVSKIFRYKAVAVIFITETAISFLHP